MKTIVRFFLFFLFLLSVGSSNAIAQDSCNVQSYVRADGVLIRGVDFENIFKNDTVGISAAMYTIDKDYYLVLRVESLKKITTYSNDLAIQFSDSTIILLPFDSNKGTRSKKMYEGYFKINSNGLGYIEKYRVECFIFTVNDERKKLVIQRGGMLQRHYKCLGNR